MLLILATVTMAKRPRWELMTKGCASVSLMMPMPDVEPAKRGSVASNLERKYAFSRLWMERWKLRSLAL